MGQNIIKLYIEKITYAGQNIGSEFEFKFNAFKNSTILNMDLKFNGERIFSPPSELSVTVIINDKPKIKRVISIHVTEFDPTPNADDTGKISLPISIPLQTKKIIPIEVPLEITTKGETKISKALLTFHFLLAINKELPAPKPPWFPDQFVPLDNESLIYGMGQSRPKCDVECLLNCLATNPSIPACAAKCCS